VDQTPERYREPTTPNFSFELPALARRSSSRRSPDQGGFLVLAHEVEHLTADIPLF
jgi:hypothetical protein